MTSRAAIRPGCPAHWASTTRGRADVRTANLLPPDHAQNVAVSQSSTTGRESRSCSMNNSMARSSRSSRDGGDVRTHQIFRHDQRLAEASCLCGQVDLLQVDDPQQTVLLGRRRARPGVVKRRGAPARSPGYRRPGVRHDLAGNEKLADADSAQHVADETAAVGRRTGATFDLRR